MALFIIPLAILVIAYLIFIWFSFAGRRLVHRFFALPVLVSMLITSLFCYNYERETIQKIPGHVVQLQPNNPLRYLPLYALRIAPLALGVCLIVNAAGVYAFSAAHRRWHRHSAQPETEPPSSLEPQPEPDAQG